MEARLAFAKAIITNRKLTEDEIVAIDNFGKNLEGLLLQLMTFHSYEDLKIIVMTSKENQHRWKYSYP